MASHRDKKVSTCSGDSPRDGQAFHVVEGLHGLLTGPGAQVCEGEFFQPGVSLDTLAEDVALLFHQFHDARHRGTGDVKVFLNIFLVDILWSAPVKIPEDPAVLLVSSSIPLAAGGLHEFTVERMV